MNDSTNDLTMAGRIPKIPGFTSETALAEAGLSALVPDMRGYGDPDKHPPAPKATTSALSPKSSGLTRTRSSAG